MTLALTLSLTATVPVATAFGNNGAPLRRKPFRIPKHKHSTSTLAEQLITKQFELRSDHRLLSSFSKNTWEAYESTLTLVLDSVVQVQKKSKRVDDYTSSMAFLFAESNPALPDPPTLTTNTDPATFRIQMDQQRQTFMDICHLDDLQYDYAVRVLTYVGDYCAKRGLATPLQIAWNKLRIAGMIPRENCISTYMYALSLEDATIDLSGEVATFHDLLFPPSENTVYLRIKRFVSKGDCQGAQGLLESLPSEDWRLLRTYSPIFEAFCKNGDFSDALRLYRQMQISPRVYFEAGTYALLISSLATRGYFRRDAKDIDDTIKAGPALLNQLAQDMANDVLEINQVTAKVLSDAFSMGFPESAITSFTGSDGDNHDDHAVVVSRVRVDPVTGTCPRTNVTLQLFQLTLDQRAQVQSTLLDMAKLQYEEFKVKLIAKFKERTEVMTDGAFAKEKLTEFSEWLDNREGEPFTAIVDGPNVGYFGHGTIKYSQIQHVVKHLESMNERPLVIMPQKYAQPRFHSSTGIRQNLDANELAVLNELTASGKLYEVPPKCLDDYYWMLASVSNQTKARSQLDDLWVPIQDGRFPGMRPMLISNDQMRDHKLDLLEPRMFRRWCSCHIVNYNFTDTYENEWEDRPVVFSPGDYFSREIQGNPTTDGSMAWHFPVSEWDEHERLCIQIPVPMHR